MGFARLFLVLVKIKKKKMLSEIVTSTNICLIKASRKKSLPLFCLAWGGNMHLKEQ